MSNFIKLYEKNSTFNTFLNQLDDIVYVKDANLNFINCNTKLTRFLSLPKSVLLGKNNTELFDQPYTKHFNQFEEKVLETKEECNFSFDFIERNKHFYFNGSITPSFDINNTLDGIIVVMKDISKFKSLEIEKEKTQNTLNREHELFENGPVLVIEWTYKNDQVTPLFISKNLTSMLGYDVDELLNLTIPWKDIIHEDDYDKARQILWVAVSNKDKSYERAYRLYDKNKNEKWIYDFSVIHYDENDNFESVHTYFLDITTHDLLKNVLNQERDLFLNGPTVFFKFNLDLGMPIEYISKNIFDLYGLDENTLVGTNFSDLIHPDDRVRVCTEYRSMINNKTSKLEQEYRILDSNGNVEWISDLAILKVHQNGNIENIYGYITNITERKEIETALIESMQDIQIWSSVSEATSEGIIIMDDKNKIIKANKAARDITGYSSNEILNSDISIFLPKSTYAPKDFRHITEEVKEHGMWQGEQYIFSKKNPALPVWVNIFSIGYNSKNKNVAIFSDISKLKESQMYLKHLAHHDPLTDLPNRVLLNERLDHALALSSKIDMGLALLFIDLDGFKHINDSLGHFIGDKLLKTIATRLIESIDEADTLARLGGDEFVILIEEYKDEKVLSAIADYIIEQISKEINIEENKLYVTASIGIATNRFNTYNSTELLKNADAAMYKAKNSGKNRYEFYNTQMTQDSYDYVNLLHTLKDAITNDEFEMYYQVQIDNTDSSIINAEALIRWNSPEHGIIFPSSFIPAAEETGLIVPIGKIVLEKSFKQMKKWKDQKLSINKLSVNLAGKQILQKDLVDCVEGLLLSTKCKPEWIELEVTEGFIMQNTIDSISKLNKLRSLGISIAIDDFGTGYSSLSYLKHLPIDKLKVDKSFVDDIPNNKDDNAIAIAVISLAKSLKLKVIAEGIEREDQLRFLSKNHCDEFQGFLFSKPITAKAFQAKFL